MREHRARCFQTVAPGGLSGYVADSAVNRRFVVGLRGQLDGQRSSRRYLLHQTAAHPLVIGNPLQ